MIGVDPGKIEEATGQLAAAAAEFQHSGQFGRAWRVYKRLAELDPADWRGLHGMGVVTYRTGRTAPALGLMAWALRASPCQPAALASTGTMLGAVGDREAAARHLAVAVSAAPAVAEYHYNLGNALQRLHRFEAAATAYRRALRLKPDMVEAGWNMGLVLLRLQRFAEGWPYYEWRWRRPGFPTERRHRPTWRGEPLAGRTLLLHSEQGLGDAMQFIRFLPAARASGADIIIECQPELVRLFQAQPGMPLVVPRGSEPPVADAQASIASLPFIAGACTGNLWSGPYLKAPDGPPTPLPPGKLRVGLVWACSPNDPSRSCPLPLAATLANVPGVVLVSLQKGPAAELTGIGVPITDFAPQIHDMADTARIVAALDLVVSVDTSVGHLAAAMGRPTWLLLPHLADWRWHTVEDSSPWYPSMRLFRQPAPGDWNSVISHVRTALAVSIAQTASSSDASWGTERPNPL